MIFKILKQIYNKTASSYVGKSGEIVLDPDLSILSIHNGTTTGGLPLNMVTVGINATNTSGQITDAQPLPYGTSQVFCGGTDFTVRLPPTLVSATVIIIMRGNGGGNRLRIFPDSFGEVINNQNGSFAYMDYNAGVTLGVFVCGTSGAWETNLPTDD